MLITLRVLKFSENSYTEILDSKRILLPIDKFTSLCRYIEIDRKHVCVPVMT